VEFTQIGARQMNQIRRHHFDLVVWVGLWGTCGLSQALGLGPSGSRVSMGEGLAFTAPVHLEAGEQIDKACVSADVFFGDDKVSDAQVRLSVARRQKGAVAVHVATTSKVNEPVLTVNVSAGCEARVSRQYVVLVDPPAASAVKSERRSEVRPEVRARPRPALSLSRDDTTSLSMRWTAPPMVTGLGAPRPPLLAAPQGTLLSSGMRMASTIDLPSGLESDNPALQARRASALAEWRALQTSPGEWVLTQARLVDLERRVAELQDWRPPAEEAVSPAAEASVPKAVAALRPASPEQGVDPDEVNQIRVVGVAGVAFIGLLAWGAQHWRRRSARGDDLRPQEPSFSLPPPSWMPPRR
jgi:pilus assembly protein FimV